MRRYSKDGYEYIYDPDNKKKPGGGFVRTDKGWVKRVNPKSKAKEKRVLDMTHDGGGDGFFIHESQISNEDKITLLSGGGRRVVKKYGNMSDVEKESLRNQLRVVGSYSHKGFSNYNNISLNTFKDNMEKNLELGEVKRIRLRGNNSDKLVKNNLDNFKTVLSDNFASLKARYGNNVKSQVSFEYLGKYEDVILGVIDKAVADGSLGDVSERELDSFLQEDMKRLIYQEMETRRRSMGDHGIRHLVSNAVNTVSILQKLRDNGIESGTTGKDMLAGMICQVNHDIGYCVGSVATDGADGTFHKTHSGTLVAQERMRYERLLGKDYADKLVGEHEVYEEDGKTPVLYYKGKERMPFDEAKKLNSTDEKYMRSKTRHQMGKAGMIQFHDDTDYDWENNALHAAVALSDCTALFGKDKLQEMFLEDDNAMESVTQMHTILISSDFTPDEKERAFAGFQNKMKKYIHNLNITENDKHFLSQQVREMTIKNKDGKGWDSIGDILTRSCGVLEGYEYDKKNNVMIVNTKYSQEGKILDDMYGNKLTRQQWEKMTKGDFGLTEMEIDDKGNQRAVYADKDNPSKSRIIVNIDGIGEPATVNKGVQRAYKNCAPRLALQKLAVYASANGGNARKKLNKMVKDYDGVVKGKSKGELLFGKGNWDKIKELLKEGKHEDLNKIPLGSAERKYLGGLFGLKLSKAVKIASRIAVGYVSHGRLAVRRYDDDVLKRYELNHRNFEFHYGTEGLLVLGHGKNGYFTRLPPEYNSLKKVTRFLERFYTYFYETDDLQGFLKASGLKWRS